MVSKRVVGMTNSLLEQVDISNEDFKRVSDVIYKHCGINLHDGKKTLVRARLAKRMRARKIDTVGKYLDYVLAMNDKKEFYDLVDSISTNLTSFFREKVHFDLLKEQFIPNMIARQEKHGGPKRFRIWSAGCSSGEEPYTMAMTLKDAFKGTSGWEVKILASDVSTRVLEKASSGLYEADKVKLVNPQLVSEYFNKEVVNGNGMYRVKDELRKMIAFRYLNLMEPWPFKGAFDVIFCRNVMIYFDKPTQEKLVGRYYDCLRPEGLLCIGHSESLTGINHQYRYLQPATYAKP